MPGRPAPAGPALRSLRSWAEGAPAHVFVIAGVRGRLPSRRLRLLPDVRVALSPRSASVLLVLGELPARFVRPLVRVHDQMPHPRATLFWAGDEVLRGAGAGGASKSDFGSDARSHEVRERFFPFADSGSGGTETLGAAVQGLYRDLLAGERLSETAIQPDHPPFPWRGKGPYGHGGKGMTGGTPYGRPLATRGADPDGLELDRLEIRVGPFFPPFPPALSIDVELQGDVIRRAIVGGNPFAGMLRRGPHDEFQRALDGPVPIAELELARVRSHLGWMSDSLNAHGLVALGARAIGVACAQEHGDDGPISSEIEKLLRRIERSRSLAWATRGIGRFVPEEPRGPVSRAAGVDSDARSDDAAYAAAGFRPVVQEDGDAWARWRQRIAECRQSLDLVARAGGRLTRNTRAVESPRGTLGSGPPPLPLSKRLPELLEGREWGAAVTIITSLDLDLESEALGAGAAHTGPDGER